ncbi:MAG: hypothetical protein KIT34_10010 [Cyanobacteria bacterium TGS_CYA1]|nr:hypothetical protein [Cyanobacteria bacterium TGS_CYA1]
MSEPLTLLHNEELIAVTFCENELQLLFDDYEIIVLAKLFVKKKVGFIHPHHEGWRDALCEQINKMVIDTKVDEDDVEIIFENEVSIFISRRLKDRTTDKAVLLKIPEYYF